MSFPAFEFFELERIPGEKIAILYLNRPDRRNAMSWPFWRDLPEVVRAINSDPEIRVCILAGRGKSFSTGLDLEEFFDRFAPTISSDTADGRMKFLDLLKVMQAGMNAIASSEKVFIAAIHRHCIGAGLDIISACDLRVASADASFSLRETRVAIVADMGSLNRLPALIGQSATRYLALTGCDIDATEAHRMGLLNFVCESQEDMHEKALDLACQITANSAMAVAGTKHILNYMLDHGSREGLSHVLYYNAAFLDSLDLRETIKAFKERRQPVLQ